MAESTDYIIDFRKEEKPEGGLRVKPGIRRARIGKCKPVRSSQKGSLGLAVPLTLLGPSDKKKKMTERLWLSPKAYHRLREILEACGKKVPQGRIDIRKIGQAVSGEEIAVNLVDDEQDGYDTKSVVKFQGGFISLEDAESEDDDDDDLDEDDEDGEEDDLDDTDDEDEEDDEPTAKQRKRTSLRKSSKRKRPRSDDDDEDDDDDLDLDDFE
jgi:hypothetical protein